MRAKRKAYKISVGRSEEKKPLGRPRCKWEDDIKMELREMGCDGMDWIGTSGRPL
jgi:hypothetical protein